MRAGRCRCARLELAGACWLEMRQQAASAAVSQEVHSVLQRMRVTELLRGFDKVTISRAPNPRTNPGSVSPLYALL